MKIGYANYFVQNMGLGDPTTWVYKLIFDENDSNDTKNYTFFYHAWTGIMHQVKQLCGTYVLCVVIQS